VKTAHCCSNPSNLKDSKSEYRKSQNDKTFRVALVGNPNAGKTTLFNALTGSHQKVGNYPGVTVEKVVGTIHLKDFDAECVDLPGLYSLQALSEDELVALNSLGGGSTETEIDLIVYVLDASNLERNLYLFARLAEFQLPTVVALTMTDRLQKSGTVLRVNSLRDALGVDVISVVGRTGAGISELKASIVKNFAEPKIPDFTIGFPDQLKEVLVPLHQHFVNDKLEVPISLIIKQLVEPEEILPSPLDQDDDAREVLGNARLRLIEKNLLNPDIEINSAYEWAALVQRQSITHKLVHKDTITDKIDAILMHRVWGILVFLAVMYVVFQSIYTFAQPLMDDITSGFTFLSNWVHPLLSGVPWVQSLVCDGIIGGVGSMLVFLPQILILFFFIGALEGSGYLARAAFLMDRLFGWCGLNGRAFIPLLSSFACAIPGIMAARVMPDKKSRLVTILVAPLMSCSARLPVYLLLIGAFIQPKYGAVWAGIALFGMHLLGLVIAIPIVWILNRKIVKGRNLPFTLELPPYQLPKLRDVWLGMYMRGRVFVTVAGTTIVAMSILIWFLSYFPRSSSQDLVYRQAYLQTNRNASNFDVQNYVDQQRLGDSYLGRFGKGIEPIFRPAGFDWRITTGILAAFPARETIIPSLGILFRLGNVDGPATNLQNSLAKAKWSDGKPLLNPYTAIGLMVFFALCCQCNSTLATVKRETNSWKWPIFMFSYMSGLAYLGAVLINQFGNFMMNR